MWAASISPYRGLSNTTSSTGGFLFKIETGNFLLSNDIINNINIVKTLKIVDYIYRVVDNGYIGNELKAFNGSVNEYYKVKLYTLKDWREKATSLIVYETIKFGLNCSSEINGECEYNLSYSLVKNGSGTPEDIIKVARDDYTNSVPICNNKISYEGKDYESYSLEYEKTVYGVKTEKRRFYETILYQKLDEDLYLIIKFNQMDKKDETDMIKTLLKLEITKEVSN